MADILKLQNVHVTKLVSTRVQLESKKFEVSPTRVSTRRVSTRVRLGQLVDSPNTTDFASDCIRKPRRTDLGVQVSRPNNSY